VWGRGEKQSTDISNIDRGPGKAKPNSNEKVRPKAAVEKIGKEGKDME